MPTIPDRAPDPYPCLKPYIFHGVDVTVRGQHGVGDCPFCGGAGNFSASVDTGLWRCWSCGGGTDRGGGNALVFLRQLHTLSIRAGGVTLAPGTSHTVRNGRVGGWVALPGNRVAAGPPIAIPGAADRAGHSARVAADRGLISATTVEAWGVGQARGGAWLVPGYAPDGRLDQLYKRTRVKDSSGEWSWRLLPTPNVWPEGRAHALHLSVGDLDAARSHVLVCEGPWDGMALWEVMRGDGAPDEWSRWQVVAVPGCNVWRDEWTEFCRNKVVTLMYDSDYPRSVVGGREARAGHDGMVRVAKRLSGVAASVRWLRWGPDGYDPTRPSGWDVRDALKEGADLDQRRMILAELMCKVEDAPAEWFSPVAPHVSGGGKHRTTEARPCSTFAECEGAWREAMKWRAEMGDALAVLLAVCASTQQAGNQLFLDLVGSAGSGKTTMCEGLLVSHHCHHLEHLTGFHSGWKPKKGEADEDEDCSLIARINGKTLVTPEFDIMRTSPRYAELMAQQRRIFDGKSGATYKNTSKDMVYSGLRTPWIRAGTPAIMDTDQASMGDRFLRFIISDPEEDEKRSIMRSALRSERAAMVERSNGTAGSILDPKMRAAHALTGGYVDYLRANAEELLGAVEVPESVEDRCIDLAELCADLRARPHDGGRRVAEAHDCKELPTRLARQNIRLAACLAAVLNRGTVDAGVMGIVRKVALDTAHGHSLSMVRWLCCLNPRTGVSYQESDGLAPGRLAVWLGMSDDRLTKYLVFLRKMDVLEMRRRASGEVWHLTDRVYDLYLRVMTP